MRGYYQGGDKRAPSERREIKKAAGYLQDTPQQAIYEVGALPRLQILRADVYDREASALRTLQLQPTVKKGTRRPGERKK